MGGLLIIAAITIGTLLWARLDNMLVWLGVFITLFYGAIGFIDDYRKVKKE